MESIGNKPRYPTSAASAPCAGDHRRLAFLPAGDVLPVEVGELPARAGVLHAAPVAVPEQEVDTVASGTGEEIAIRTASLPQSACRISTSWSGAPSPPRTSRGHRASSSATTVRTVRDASCEGDPAVAMDSQPSARVSRLFEDDRVPGPERCASNSVPIAGEALRILSSRRRRSLHPKSVADTSIVPAPLTALRSATGTPTVALPTWLDIMSANVVFDSRRLHVLLGGHSPILVAPSILLRVPGQVLGAHAVQDADGALTASTRRLSIPFPHGQPGPGTLPIFWTIRKVFVAVEDRAFRARLQPWAQPGTEPSGASIDDAVPAGTHDVGRGPHGLLKRWRRCDSDWDDESFPPGGGRDRDGHGPISQRAPSGLVGEDLPG